MKTWEMIKEITENPEKKFKEKSFGQVEMFKGYLVQSSNMDIIVINKDILEKEWEEVKEPVDFMAAVKSGKRFKLINKDDAEGVLTRYMDLNTFMNTLANMWSKELSKAILTEGKFYIED